jgi:hypothetical protein
VGDNISPVITFLEVKAMAKWLSENWPVGLVSLFIGFILGVVLYFVMYSIAADGVKQRLKDQDRIGYTIESPHYNIGCKGIPLLS